MTNNPELDKAIKLLTNAAPDKWHAFVAYTTTDAIVYLALGLITTIGMLFLLRTAIKKLRNPPQDDEMDEDIYIIGWLLALGVAGVFILIGVFNTVDSVSTLLNPEGAAIHQLLKHD